MTTRAGLFLVAVLAVLATSVAAQEVDPAPTVEIDEAEVPGLVVPLDEPGSTTVDVRVGCEAHEVPTTDTLVALTVPSAPEWLNVIVSPSAFSWTTAPEDCPSEGTPFEATAIVSISTNQDAPAYREEPVRIEAEVVKEPPGDAEQRTYGPHEGNVTLTPGYYHAHDVRADRKIREASAGETIRFTATVRNLANHETVYSFRSVAEPGFDVRHEPATLVLDPSAAGEFAVEVHPVNGSVAGSETVGVTTHVRGNSTHPLGGEGGESEVAFLAEYGSSRSGPRSIPTTGAPAIAALGLALALVVAERDRRSRL